MAQDAQYDHASTARPVSIAGRTDIAKVVFHDGHSINFPSIASVASPPPPSYSTATSTLQSRSPSEKRGRDRARSFSSTSSSNPFSVHSLPSISDDGVNDHYPTLPALVSPMTDGLTHSLGHVEQTDVSDEWIMPRTVSHDHWTSDPASYAISQTQDHLVAKADGAHHDLPTQLGDMNQTLDSFLGSQKTDDPNGPMSEGEMFGTCTSSPSAPIAPGMIRQGSADNAMPLAAARTGDRHNSIDSSHLPVGRVSRKPGRAPGSKLPEEKRKKIAAMRQLGACNYCREGRRGCDPGTPCKPCILHFGPDVLDEPNMCRKDIIESLSKQILAKACKWHPYPREMSDFFGRDIYVTDGSFDIPVQFGFGPYLTCSVRVVESAEPSRFQHNHVHYASLVSNTPEVSRDYVLPVAFTDPTKLFSALDRHLELIVKEHLSQFTIPNSNLRILDKILKLYTHYAQGSCDYAALLHQALKFLVLVHNSEIIVPTDDPSVAHVLRHWAPGYTHGPQRVTPCLLRAEFGKVLPQLARIILKDVLKRLLRICLTRRCDQHPPIIATFAILTMAIESIMYQSSRIGYHAHSTLPGPGTTTTNAREADRDTNNPFASMTHPIEASAAMEVLERAAGELRNIYGNCFENCHAILLRTMDERHYIALQKSFGEIPAAFITALNQAICDAAGYLQSRASEQANTLDDPSHVFDRLLASLLLLKTSLN